MSNIISLEGMEDVLLFKMKRRWWQARFKMPREIQEKLKEGKTDVPEIDTWKATIRQVEKDCKPYKAMTTFMSRTYDWVVKRRVVPGIFPGVYFMKRQGVEPIDTYLKSCVERLPALVKDLQDVYPEIKDTMRRKLNGAYDDKLYPVVDELPSLHEITWGWLQLGIPDLPSNVAQEQQAKMLALMKDAWEAVNDRLVLDTMEFLKVTLPQLADNKDFRDSFVPKIREFIETFDMRNVSNFAGLETLVQRMKAVMTDSLTGEWITNNDLRRDANIRSVVRETLAVVDTQLPEMLSEPKPLRKIEL